MKTSCLRQLGKLRIDGDGERQVGHRTAFVDRHCMWELVNFPNQEVSRIFVGGLGCGRALGQGWNHKRFVPPALVPGARKGHFAEALLPDLASLRAAVPEGRQLRARQEYRCGP